MTTFATEKNSLAMKRILLTVFVISLYRVAGFAQPYLFGDKKSEYVIVVDKQASKSELNAARELQKYIQQMSGAKLPVVNTLNPSGKAVFIGYNASVARLTGKPQPASSDEGFTYMTVGENLFIFGGSDRGTMFGVFAFLEQQLGVRWYAPDCTKVPTLSQWKLPQLNHHEEPAFKYREVFSYEGLRQKVWRAHNLANCYGKGYDNYGPSEFFWSAHTMGKFVSASEFFASHPEYFSLRDGKRIENGQLCLSNKEVIAILKQRLLQAIKEHPDNWAYDLSPNDNEKDCTCPNCQAMIKRYGGMSGLALWVVNQVAEEVAKQYPDKMVSMLAYKTTQKPPIGIKPAKNVVIRLCSMHSCRLHPLTDQENRPFVEAYDAWRKLTPNIFIWDYEVNFQQYLLPFPSIATMAPNMQLFHEYGALGVRPQAQHSSTGGEFAELRQWIMAKMLWNPYQETEPLVQDFIKGYYGKAATDVQQYYDLCLSLQDGNWHLARSTSNVLDSYPEEFIRQGSNLLKHARQQVKDDSIMVARIDRLRMQTLMLKLLKHRGTSILDGTLQELRRIMETEKPFVKENLKYDDFLKQY